MSETVWAAILGAIVGAAVAFMAGERQRLNVYKAQIWDEARREIAPKLDSYGYWLIGVRRMFLDVLSEEDRPTQQSLLEACRTLDEVAPGRDLQGENMRSLRYYRVALPQYSAVADDLLAAHAQLGEALDMAWLYFRSDVAPEKCARLARIAAGALTQYAVFVGQVRDSVLDDVLQPVFHPVRGRWHIRERRREAKRTNDVDFESERYPEDWDAMSLKYERGEWRLKERLLLFHPDLQDLLDEDWNLDEHGPREGLTAD
jgi:hypothetical protein